MDIVAFMGVALTLIAFLLGFMFGNMIGRWNGFRDAQRKFDAEVDKIEDTWEPKRDARGRFVKRK